MRCFVATRAVWPSSRAERQRFTRSFAPKVSVPVDRPRATASQIRTVSGAVSGATKGRGRQTRELDSMNQTADTAARFWDKLADKYSKKPISDPAAYARKLDATRERLRPTDTVLDIGCGTGSLALELAADVAHVHALDLSGEMIRIANEKAARAGTKNVTFYSTTIEKSSSFSTASFDHVCAYNILHLVHDLDATLAKIFTLLKPGGSFISSTACLRETWVPVGLMLPLMRWVGKAPHVLMLSVADLEESLRGCRALPTSRGRRSPTPRPPRSSWPANRGEACWPGGLRHFFRASRLAAHPPKPRAQLRPGVHGDDLAMRRDHAVEREREDRRDARPLRPRGLW